MANKYAGITDAQKIMEMGSSRNIRNALQKAQKQALSRMEALKNAGYEQSEFYKAHRTDFKEVPFGKENMAKELAMTNRFLASESSDVEKIASVREQTVKKFNKSLFGDESDGPINMENLDRFTDFMRFYRENIKRQTNLQSDTVVDAFLLAEKLHISHKDILTNLDLFSDYQKELQSMELEDMFPDGKVDNRYRFKVGDYIDAFIDKQMYK